MAYWLKMFATLRETFLASELGCSDPLVTPAPEDLTDTLIWIPHTHRHINTNIKKKK